jgi:hypothetical protein
LAPKDAKLETLLANAEFAQNVARALRNGVEFGLEPAGIRLYFQEYGVLPYVFGLPTAFIPLADLQSALPRAEIWSEAKEWKTFTAPLAAA